MKIPAWLNVCALLVVALAMTSCATPIERIAHTASGKPEVTIATVDVGKIKSMIIGDMINHGYTVEADTEYSLAMSRKATGGEDMLAALSIGNSYSSNSRITSYTFVKDGGSVRVVCSTALRAQMPGGQMNSQIIERNDVFNNYQQQLMDIKKKIEGTVAAPPDPMAAAK